MQALEPVLDGLFEFDEPSHRYFYGGASIPGVSAILKEAGHQKFDHIDPEVLERARQFGVEAHKATEIHDKGGIPQMDSLLRFCFNAYLKYLDTHQPEQIEIERPVLGRVGNLLYGGIVDRIWRLDGKLLLVDLKTSSKVYESHKLQVCAYRLAYPDLPQPAILKIPKILGRNARLTLLSETEVEDYTQEWKRCVESYYWKKNHGVLDDKG